MADHLEAAYEKRVVVYGDILGWRAATADRSKFERQKKAVDKIGNYVVNFSSEIKGIMEHALGVPLRTIAEHAAIEFSFFSDSFAVSAPLAHTERVFEILAHANDELLRKEFLSRGGISLGDLFHCEGRIFGPALLEAIQMEHDAKYPRFLCSEALLTHLDESGLKHKLVLRDSYGALVANIACGSVLARNDHLRVIQKQRHLSESIAQKWRYMEEMLPIMYEGEI